MARKIISEPKPEETVEEIEETKEENEEIEEAKPIEKQRQV
jgi:hypothetical protein